MAGVMVTATTKDQASITITEIAMEPTKSPAGPGSSRSGRKDRIVVTVEAASGMVSRRTDPATASSRVRPAVSRLPTSSVITMAASTSRPSATINPVTLIWWIGTASAFSVATEASDTTGSTIATISADRHPRVTNRTATTSTTPTTMFRPTSLRRSVV